MAAGFATREVTKPGFYHNLHSINHFHISDAPWFKDLGLADRVTYITPRYEFGQAHLDGTALVLGRDLEETVANIARFSQKDARPSANGTARAEEITARILMPERYAEPLPQAEREALLVETAIGRDFLDMTRRQPLDVVEELFENEHVKLLFLFKVSLFGTWLTDTLSKTSPMGSVIRAFDLQTGYQLCQGGSFNLARGLMETFIAAGGTFQPQVVDRPHRDRRRTRDRHRARRRPHRAGARNSSPAPSTCIRPSKQLIGREQLPDGFRKQARRISIHRLDAVRAASGAAREPALCGGGVRSQHQPRAEMEHRRRDDGRTCSPRIRTCRPDACPSSCNSAPGPLSLLDPTQAPPGKHTTYAWHVMPLAPRYRRAGLRGLQGGILRQDQRDLGALLPEHDQGQHHRPAMSTRRANTCAEFPNMRDGDIFMGAFNAEQVMYNHFGYRTPIPNLYYAGSAAHPGGAISGGPATSRAGIIARDLGLEAMVAAVGCARGARSACRRRREATMNSHRRPPICASSISLR